MSEEWGPWIDHDGKGCPVVGQVVQIMFGSGDAEVVVAGAVCAKHGVSPDSLWSCWVWGGAGCAPYEIIRYRVRKPRGLTILENLLADLPAPTKRKEKA